MRSYLSAFFLSVLMIFTLLVAVNWFVDPYWVSGAPLVRGVNAVKPVVSNKQRVFETIQALLLRPETVILGTSRADIGIDPQHPAFKNQISFNAGISGQPILETRKLLEHLLSNPDGRLKRAVIGLDFDAFNSLAPVPFDYDDSNFTKYRRYQLLASLTTSLDAGRTLIKQDAQKLLVNGGLVHENGLRQYYPSPQFTARQRFVGTETEFLERAFRPPPFCDWQARSGPASSRDSLADFRQILSIAHKENIDLKLFISPSHAWFWEALRAVDLWERFEDWKRQLVRLNSDEAIRAGREPFALWDFSGYNSVTSESVPSQGQRQMRWYWESSHYKTATGNLLLDRVFGRSTTELARHPDFGRLLKAQKIEGALADIRVERDVWTVMHSEDAIAIRAMAERAKANGPCAHSKMVRSTRIRG